VHNYFKFFNKNEQFFIKRINARNKFVLSRKVTKMNDQLLSKSRRLLIGFIQLECCWREIVMLRNRAKKTSAETRLADITRILAQ